MLYECLTGRAALSRRHHANSRSPRTEEPAAATRRAPIPACPQQVDEVIATGMAKDPDQRYATTVELADAARDAITVATGTHRPNPTLLGGAAPGDAARRRPPVRRPADPRRAPGTADPERSATILQPTRPDAL